MTVFLSTLCIAPLYADPAPVYDADAMMQQSMDDASMENTQDLPPPPPPTQDSAYPSTTMPSQNSNPIIPRQQALSVEQRIRRVEQQINNMQNSDVGDQVQSLQGQVQSLRGQLEQMTHQLDELQKQQKNMYSDVDRRLSQTNARKPAVDNSNIPANQYSQAQKPAPIKAIKTMEDNSQPNGAEEQRIYQVAYNYIKAKKYNEAITTLQGMLKKYPSGQFAANAHYWLGELYGLLGKHDQALTEFALVVSNFPDSPRVSDAQLKVGLIYAAQSKFTEAKLALHKVVSRYPGTASARLAKEQLKQIKDTGH